MTRLPDMSSIRLVLGVLLVALSLTIATNPVTSAGMTIDPSDAPTAPPPNDPVPNPTCAHPDQPLYWNTLCILGFTYKTSHIAKGGPAWYAARMAGAEETEKRIVHDYGALELARDAAPYEGGMVAVVDVYDGNGYEPVVVRFDGNENILWEKTLSLDIATHHLQASSITVDSEGRIVLTGIAAIPNQKRVAWVMQIDEDGEEIWSRVIDSDTSVDRWMWPQVVLDDSDNLHGLVTYDSSPPTVQLYKWDASGNDIWVRNSETTERYDRIAQAPDGTIFLTGAADGELTGNPVVRRVDDQGHLITEQEIDLGITPNPNASHKVLGFQVGPTGDLWLSGVTHTFIGQQSTQTIPAADGPVWIGSYVQKHEERGFVAKVTADLELEWMTHVVLGEESPGGGFAFHPNGGVIVTGWTVTEPNVVVGRFCDSYVAHVTDDGSIAFTRVVGEDGSESCEAARYVTVSDDGRTIWTLGEEWYGGGGPSLAPGSSLLVTRSPSTSEYAPITGPLAELNAKTVA